MRCCILQRVQEALQTRCHLNRTLEEDRVGVMQLSGGSVCPVVRRVGAETLSMAFVSNTQGSFFN